MGKNEVKNEVKSEIKTEVKTEIKLERVKDEPGDVPMGPLDVDAVFADFMHDVIEVKEEPGVKLEEPDVTPFGAVAKAPPMTRPLPTPKFPNPGSAVVAPVVDVEPAAFPPPGPAAAAAKPAGDSKSDLAAAEAKVDAALAAAEKELQAVMAGGGAGITE